MLESYVKDAVGQMNTNPTVEIYDSIHKIPGLSCILKEKNTRAEMRGIKFNIAIMGEEINLRYCSDLDYSRMIGILLDNALEAADESTNKIMELIVRFENGRLENIIMNSCDKEVDVSRIFERDYSTKLNPSGEGLYQIKLMQDKYREIGYTIDITPAFREGFFTQILVI